MAFSTTIGQSAAGVVNVSSSKAYTGGGRSGLDTTVATGVTDQEHIVAVDVSQIQAIIISSSQNVTLETNGVKATGTLTLAANMANAETITLDTKVYTFEDELTEVDGNVHIGASASDTIDNLIAAVTLSGGVSGTDYAAAMTQHTTVTAAVGAGDTMGVTAISIGTGGNSIATTETGTNSSFGGGTLSGGVDADETLAIVAEFAYLWTTDSLFTNLLLTDITKIHLTNASGSTATVKMENVYDDTV